MITAEAAMKGALRAKHDLLNHENENIRAAADEIYQQYLKVSYSHRRNLYVRGKTI
ncbi:MAG TPA: hypothetical protein VFZ55_05430 [Nitrososphaera sp.]